MTPTATSTSTTVTVANTGTLAVNALVVGTGVPANDFISSITNGTTFVLTTAATTNASNGLTIYNPITETAGAAIDLGGAQSGPSVSLTTPKPLVITGAGITGLAENNTLSALVNSSTTTAVLYPGPVILSANASVGNSTFYASNVPGSIVTASPTAVAGDITLSSYLDGAFTLTKVGSDTLFLTSAAGSLTNLTVNEGTVVFQGSGAMSVSTATTNQITSGGTLILDNTTTAVNNRMGGRGMLLYGNSTVLGNKSTAVVEDITTTGNNFNFGNSGAVVTLAPAASGAAVELEVNIASTALWTRSAGATALIRGTALGRVLKLMA